MKWKIIADSSCDPIYGDLSEKDLKVVYVPFSITTDKKEYVDDENIDVAQMVKDMEDSKNPCKTACPPSGVWMKEFEEADNCICITISSNLSGSYESACVAKKMMEEENPNKKIIVLDSKAAGSELSLGLYNTVKLIKQGDDIETIETKMNKFFLDTHIIFTLCSFENLIKNGRMNRIVGFVAKTLKMWGIGIGSDEGTIVIKGKVRTENKVVEAILQEMEEKNFNNGQVAISACLNEKFANRVKDEILKKWPNSTIQVGPTVGLCSFYAEREGIIVSFI